MLFLALMLRVHIPSHADVSEGRDRWYVFFLAGEEIGCQLDHHLHESTHFLYPIHWRRYSSSVNNTQVVTDLPLEAVTYYGCLSFLFHFRQTIVNSPKVDILHP